MIVMSAREWDDIKAERKRLQDGIAARDLELGGLRAQNVQLHRENSSLAHQMELVIVQLAVANDERTALLRARGVAANDMPTFHVEHPAPLSTAVPTQAWHGTPMDDEAEAAKTLAAVDASAAASLFDDPGDEVAAALGRRHNEFGEVEHLQGGSHAANRC